MNFYLVTALTITLHCAFAGYSTKNYAISPIKVAHDSDSHYTKDAYLSLAHITGGNSYIVSQRIMGLSSHDWLWGFWSKELDAKTLSPGADYHFNKSSAYNGINDHSFSYHNNTIWAFGRDFDSYSDHENVAQLCAYQAPISSGAPFQILICTSNKDRNWRPKFLGHAQIAKTVYIFYLAAHRRVNVTSFIIGGVVQPLEFTLTSNFDFDHNQGKPFSVAWEESFGNNLYANWFENGVLNGAVVDVINGTVNKVTFDEKNKITFAEYGYCLAYAINNKGYGDLCYESISSEESHNHRFFMRTNNNIVNLTKFVDNIYLNDFFPYGPYLALVWQEREENIWRTSLTYSYSYEIWDLDTLTTIKPKTYFLTDDNELPFYLKIYKAPSGGILSLLYNNRDWSHDFCSNIQVGLLLDKYPNNNSSKLISSDNNSSDRGYS